MIGYTTLGVSDLAAAQTFYLDLFADRGAAVKADAGRIVFIGVDGERTMLALCTPYDGEDHSVGNGNMIAFACKTKEEIDAMHARALELGATTDGDPGQRIPDRFYGAYVRDPDGHKLCFYIFK